MTARRRSRSSITSARTSASAARGTPWPFAQLVDEVQRDVQLADRAERLRQAADLALRLAGLGVLEPLGQHRHRLAQAAGRDPRLVDADVLAGDGGGELSPQCARATLEEADQR